LCFYYGHPKLPGAASLLCCENISGDFIIFIDL
jgi:hypothetical protein